MTTTIEYSQFLELDYPEGQVDQFGYARLRDKARDQGLTLVGDVSRVHDAPVYSVPNTMPDGTIGISYVEMDAKLAGSAAPAARLVRWSIAVQPTIAMNPVVVVGTVVEAGKLARAALPEAVTESGGLVEFQHNLGGEPEVRAYGPEGEVGTSYNVPIDNTRVEIMLTPGAVRLEAVLDEEEEEGSK